MKGLSIILSGIIMLLIMIPTIYVIAIAKKDPGLIGFISFVEINILGFIVGRLFYKWFNQKIK